MLGANNLGQIGTDLVVSYEDEGRCEEDRSTCNSMKPSEALSPSGLHIAGEYVLVPQKVEGLGDEVRSISAFGDTSCALTADGAVMCWGNNSRLEIGSFANTIRFNDAEDDDSYSHYTPVPIVVEGFASGVSLLGQRCAVRVGQVACWGQNNASELNFDNDDEYMRLRPREAVITGMDGEVQALLGLHYMYQPSLLSLTCGLVDGAAHCWESEIGSVPNDGPDPYTLQSFTSPELQKNVVAMGDTCAMVSYDNPAGGFGVWCWGRFELSDGMFEAGVGVPNDLYNDTYDVSFEMPWLAFCYSEGAFYRPVGRYGDQECGAPPAN